MEDELRKMSALQRVEYDFQVLYNQQVEMQKITKQEDVCLIQMHSRYQEKPYSATSLLFLTVTNPFRKFIIGIALNGKFDTFILAAIMFNCLLMAIDDYTTGEWKLQVDMVLTIVFTGECVLKILAMGFLFGKNSYLTDPWNMLDFFVVTTGVMGMFTGGSNMSVLRTIRILRPLRTINSIPEMKVLTVSILASIPMLVDIFVLILMFILIFALVGAQLYGGNFSIVCFNMDGTTDYQICAFNPGCKEYMVNCGTTGCEENQYCWDSGENPNQGLVNFDNLAFGFLTIFTAMTMSGWSDTMRMGRAALNAKLLNDVFFYFLIIIGSFFLMQLTVAAIFVKFMESSKAQKSRIKLIEVSRPPIDFTPQKPDADKESKAMKWYRFRMDFYHKIHTDWFSGVTMTIIIINTLVMGSEYYGMTPAHIYVADKLNIILNIFFAIEMIMKLIGLGLRGYAYEIMNIFDGVIVIMGIIEISLEGVKGLLVLRAFRMLRIFKLARKWKTLKTMLIKLINSMKAISYLALLMLIIMFIYTLLGKQLFQFQMDDGDGGNPRANFDNLFWAFITVFTILTQENWNGIMANAVGPTNVLYSLFFVSFIVIGTCILLNLFLAILIEQFENYEPGSDDEEDLEAARLAEEEAGKI